MGVNSRNRKNNTRKTTKKCKDLDMSIQPAAFKKLSPESQVAWHMCYSKRLTRRAAHIKRAREKQWLKLQAKDQLNWAEEIRKKHKLSKVEVE